MLTTIKQHGFQEPVRTKTGKAASPQRVQRQADGWPTASVWMRQQDIGFSCVSSFTPIQAKLTIGQPGDRYEQEADRIADQVVEKIGNGKTETESSGGVRNPSIEQGGGSPQGMNGAVQRQCAECEEKDKEKTLQTKPLAAEITPLVQRQEAPGAKEEEEPSGEAPEPEETVQEKTDSTFPIQRAGEEGGDVPEQEEKEEPASLQTKAESPGAGTASSSLTSRLQATKGGGQPLSIHTRAQMEGAFGADFRGVRIHTDASAVDMNRALRAQAFTHGRDIYFGAGRFQPESTEGRRLLAHELVHVGQQMGEKEEPLLKFQKAEYSSAGNLTFIQLQQNIVNAAEARYTNTIIRDSYKGNSWWTFSPKKNHAHYYAKEKITIQNLGKKYSHAIGLIKKKVGKNFEKWPTGEGVLYFGCFNLNRCNLFVFDVLEKAGLNPPLGLPDRIYYNAQSIVLGHLVSYLKEVKLTNEVKKGDIFTKGDYHMGIVLSKVVKGTSFEAMDYDYKNGLNKTTYVLRGDKKRFWRVRQGHFQLNYIRRFTHYLSKLRR